MMKAEGAPICFVIIFLVCLFFCFFLNKIKKNTQNMTCKLLTLIPFVEEKEKIIIILQQKERRKERNQVLVVAAAAAAFGSRLG